VSSFPEAGTWLATAIDAGNAGARELMRRWRHLEPWEIDEKAANDLVTAADRASEDAILRIIRERHPNQRILAEESGGEGFDGPGPVWIVDPLDGTTNFVHGVPHWAISIAVAVDGEPVVGVVLDPLKGDRFTAAPGKGAAWNGRPCRVSGRTGLAGALLATGFPFKAHDLIDRYLAIFKTVFLRAKAIRRPGAAALDLAYVAAGIFDGFFEFRLSPWDIAAGTALVREAGGTVTGIEGDGRFLAHGDVLAAAPGVHRELLEAIASVP